MDMPTIQLTVAVPTFNRPAMTLRCFENILNDARVAQVVIVDDASDVVMYEELEQLIEARGKIALFRNETNRDCYRNKKTAVELSSTDWVLLADSDNVFTDEYLYHVSLEGPLSPDTIYAPIFAKPNFNYSEFS